MGNLWRQGQVGTRVLAGAAGTLLGGPAGAAIGAGVVGPMIADLVFGKGQIRDKQLYNWNEPSSYMAYQDSPDTRLSTTVVREDPNLQFKGGLKTFDTLANTVGSFLSGGGILGNGLKSTTDAAGSVLDNIQGGLAKGISAFGKKNEVNDPFSYREIIKKWAGQTANSTEQFNGLWGNKPAPLI